MIVRIIAGKYKRRKINLPKVSKRSRGGNFQLRPTSDRARETLFDVLNNIVDFDSAACLDLFSGTGSVGFEFLSRGASGCEFVDLSKDSLSAIDKTASELGCLQQIRTVRKDVLAFLKENESSVCDIVFADPPYEYEKYDELVGLVLKTNPILFVLETSAERRQLFKAIDFELLEKPVGAAKFYIFASK